MLREERRLRVFESRVLRRIFGPRRNEVTGELRKLHNEKLNGLYCSPSIVRVMKSRRMGWAGHVARMGEKRGVYIGFVGKTDETDLRDPDLEGRIILRWNFSKWDEGAWTGSSWLRIGTGAGHL